MTPANSTRRAGRTRARSRRRNLLVIAGLPLLALHVGLLVERATHRETLDATVVLRWILSIVLLVILQRGMGRTPAFQARKLGMAALLIFVLIHAPVIAPEPSAPLAATSLGLALGLVVVGRRFSAVSTPRSMVLTARADSAAWIPFVSPEALKDRAPPCAA